MRRSSIIIVLMLSLLVPLQTAADTLAAALMCAHEQAEMPSPIIPDADSDHSSMKCCPQAHPTEKTQQQKTSDCQQMKCCQWCYANRIALTSIPPIFICTNTSPPIAPEFSLISTTPVSVWRPPTTY